MFEVIKKGTCGRRGDEPATVLCTKQSGGKRHGTQMTVRIRGQLMKELRWMPGDMVLLEVDYVSRELQLTRSSHTDAYRLSPCTGGRNAAKNKAVNSYMRTSDKRLIREFFPNGVVQIPCDFIADDTKLLISFPPAAEN